MWGLEDASNYMYIIFVNHRKIYFLPSRYIYIYTLVVLLGLLFVCLFLWVYAKIYITRLTIDLLQLVEIWLNFELGRFCFYFYFSVNFFSSTFFSLGTKNVWYNWNENHDINVENENDFVPRLTLDGTTKLGMPGV